MRKNATTCWLPAIVAAHLALAGSAWAVVKDCPGDPDDPCSITYEMSFGLHEGPLTAEDKTRYCGIVREFSRQLWRTTEAKHHVGEVRFVFNDWGADAVWNRRNGRAYYTDIGQVVYMYDAFVGCTISGDQGCQEQQAIWGLPPGDFKCNLTHDEWDPELETEVEKKYCSYDGGTTWPDDAVLQTDEQLGAVLLHELGHQLYNLDDEYVYADNGEGFPWGAAVCDNDSDGVCLMAATRHPHWCDNDHDPDDPDAPITWSHVNYACDANYTGPPEFCADYPPDGVSCVGGACGVSIFKGAEYGCWGQAKLKQTDLQSVHQTIGTYPDDNALPPVPQEMVCVWSPFTANDDSALMIDRSGSMGHVGQSGVEAVVEVADGALEFFNASKPGKESGVLMFNSGFQWLEPYQDFDLTMQQDDWDPPYDEGSGGITASGSTDICGAIIEMTNTVRQVHPAKQYDQGDYRDEVHGVLFTDGKQTVEYQGTPCFPNFAANVGCRPEWDHGKGLPYPPVEPTAPRIRTHVIGYGDADFGELEAIAYGGCTGQVWAAGQQQQAPPGEPDPQELKIYLARMRTLVNRQDEIFDERHNVNAGSIETRTFDVPAASAQLDFVWVGNRYLSVAAGAECRFGLLEDFRLTSPSGTDYTVSPVQVDETEYNVRSIRVIDPEPGTWRARMDATQLFCPPDHKLDVAWLAGVTNDDLLGGIWVQPRRARIDEPVNLVARMYHGADLAGIGAVARVFHDGQSWDVVLQDDGQHGDGGANDGWYGGTFNETGNVMPQGNYSVRVTLQSSATAWEVDTGVPAPGPAQVLAETFFHMNPSYSTTPDGRNRYVGSVVAEFGGLLQGQSYTGLAALVDGLPLDAAWTIVGLGPGVQVDNISVQFDHPFDQGRVVFDAVVAPGAVSGPRTLTVQAGQAIARQDDATFVGCQVPNPATPGEVTGLRLGRGTAPGMLELQWQAAADAVDGHTFYAGALDGAFDSLQCLGGPVPAGATSAAFPTAPGSRYYLVRGLNAGAASCGNLAEGPLGNDSSGGSRVPAATPCAAAP